MNIFILIGAVFLQTVASYDRGVGSYSYTDSSGRRYEGVYGLKDGKVVHQDGNLPPNFQPQHFDEPNFQDLDSGDFFPEYFKNLGNILEDGFPYMPPTPYLPSTPFMPRRPRPTFAMPSPTPFSVNTFGAYSPYDDYDYDYRGRHYNGLNSYNPSFGANPFYRASTFSPNFRRYPPGFEGFDDAFRNAHGNTAYASGTIGRGFKEQVAAINPENPLNPNVKVTRLSDPSNGGFKSVSVSSFSSSSDINGRKSNTRKASTIINDNGKISRYDVSN